MTRLMKKGKSDREKVYISEKLRAKFDKILQYPLTSIEAPIGYGKTRSCMEYLKTSDQLYVWRNISGRDCGVCWQQFCSALSEIDTTVAEKLKSYGMPENNAAAERAVEVIGQIRQDKPVLIVIDTVMDRMPESISYFLEILARKNISYLHFVMIGRVRFCNHREELRMKHLLLVIDVFDFMLDRDDIVRYFELCGILIGRGDAERLRRKTDGWIAALYLTLLHWDEDNGRLQVPEQIYDLFQQTLCRNYSEEQLDFLMKISPFHTFTMDQARSVREMRDPEKILEFLTDSSGFIWKIPETHTYHINRLYRNYLQNMLETRDPEFRKKVYKNAADWFYHNRTYYKASYYYYRSGEYEHMLKAFEMDCGGYLCASDLYEIRAAYEECPEEIRDHHFLSLMIYARQLSVSGKEYELEKILKKLESEDYLSAFQEADLDEFRGELEMLQGYLTCTQPLQAAQHQKQCVSLLRHTTAQAGRRSPVTFGSPSILFLLYTEAGRLDDLLKEYSGTRNLYYRLTDNNGRGSEYLFDAEIQFNRGNLEKADILSHKAGTVAARYHQTGIGICAYFLQARIRILKGETDQGMKFLDQITTLTGEIDKRVYAVTGELCESYIYAVFNQLKYVADWIDRGDYLNSGEMRLYRPAEDFANIVFARILIDKGEFSRYLGMVDEMLALAEKSHDIIAQIYHHVYSAAAYRKMSLRDSAANSLRRAMELAADDGIIMPFAESGRLLGDFYQQISLSQKEKEFVEKCLKLYNKYEKHMNVLLGGSGDTALNVLTRREREISLLVAEGKTNKQIAGELNIAEITVKKCLSNIYARLGIPNRASLIKKMIS